MASRYIQNPYLENETKHLKKNSNLPVSRFCSLATAVMTLITTCSYLFKGAHQWKNRGFEKNPVFRNVKYFEMVLGQPIVANYKL